MKIVLSPFSLKDKFSSVFFSGTVGVATSSALATCWLLELDTAKLWVEKSEAESVCGGNRVVGDTGVVVSTGAGDGTEAVGSTTDTGVGADTVVGDTADTVGADIVGADTVAEGSVVAITTGGNGEVGDVSGLPVLLLEPMAIEDTLDLLSAATCALILSFTAEEV